MARRITDKELSMKIVATLIAIALVSAASLVLAAPAEGRRGAGMERLRAADTNGDGMISRQEAQALPRVAGKFDAVDANGDGQLTMEELHAFHKAHRSHEARRKLDTDGDGRISKAEAADAPRLAQRFDAIDADGDGFISHEEMKAAHPKRQAAAK
jgi:Ca2+-binding EF-hand superfamily protein